MNIILPTKKQRIFGLVCRESCETHFWEFETNEEKSLDGLINENNNLSIFVHILTEIDLVIGAEVSVAPSPTVRWPANDSQAQYTKIKKGN